MSNKNHALLQRPSAALVDNRNKIVAKTFFKQLKDEGFSPEQIIELSANLLELVTADLQDTESAKQA